MPDEDDRRRLTVRGSILVWIASAVIGWMVAVVGAYYVLRTGGSLMATLFGGDAGHETAITEDEMRRLREIAPAAGPTASPPPEATPTPAEE